MLHFKYTLENRTGLQIKIATFLTVLEQNFFLLWVGICIEMCTQDFVILDEKLWSRQHSKAEYRKKVNFAVFSGP